MGWEIIISILKIVNLNVDIWIKSLPNIRNRVGFKLWVTEWLFKQYCNFSISNEYTSALTKSAYLYIEHCTTKLRLFQQSVQRTKECFYYESFKILVVWNKLSPIGEKWGGCGRHKCVKPSADLLKGINTFNNMLLKWDQ